MEEGSQEEGMRARVKNRLLKALGSIWRAQKPPSKGSGRAPSPEMFRPGFAKSAKWAGKEFAGGK